MCLKDDIKFAQNSANITLSSINDENPATFGTDSSNFTITLPTHPNTKNYKQALVQVQSLHCPPLSMNPPEDNVITSNVNSSVYGVAIDGLGVMNSYISGQPSNIVGVGAPHSAQVNQIDRSLSKCGKDLLRHPTTLMSTVGGVSAQPIHDLHADGVTETRAVTGITINEASLAKLKTHYATNIYPVIIRGLHKTSNVRHDSFTCQIHLPAAGADTGHGANLIFEFTLVSEAQYKSTTHELALKYASQESTGNAWSPKYIAHLATIIRGTLRDIYT